MVGGGERKVVVRNCGASGPGGGWWVTVVGVVAAATGVSARGWARVVAAEMWDTVEWSGQVVRASL